LKANPLLIEVTGAKVIFLKDGRRIVLGVASTAIKDGTAKDRPVRRRFAAPKHSPPKLN